MLAVCALAALAAHDAHGATTIVGTEVSWDITDSKGNTYWWSMPVTTYEDNIVESRYHVRDKVNLDLDGETLRVVSLDGFVRESFVNVIDNIYDNSYGNSDFIWEVWHVVSQLTVYDEDIHEYSEGRYALETLTRGGGDCEDLVILVADMLMSSSHTDGWTIQFVMMDGDSPTDPQDIDHVILYVDDGEYAHYIEATGPPSWDYYPEGVNGWYLDVVLYAEDLDFVGQDLRWMDLAGSNLAGAAFTDTRLTGADLTGADLSYVDLAGADLSWAGLRSANLSFAGLAGANLPSPTCRAPTCLTPTWLPPTCPMRTCTRPTCRTPAWPGRTCRGPTCPSPTCHLPTCTGRTCRAPTLPAPTCPMRT